MPMLITCTDLGLTQCPTTAPFHDVSMTTNSEYRIISTTGCPPYSHGWTNPVEACEADVMYEIPLTPTFASTPIPVGSILKVFADVTYLKEDPAPIFGSLGVFENGVFIFGVGSPCGFGSDCPDENSAAPSEYVDAVESEGHTVDSCGGHAAPTGHYHMHSGLSLDVASQRQACGLPLDTSGDHSVRLGWMFDGFGIYGRYSQGGLVPKDLDECNGHTHEIDGVMTYHYHLPDAFPWTIGCFKGCPKVSNNMQLSFANNGEYGCPQGLTEDPDPLIEPPPSTSSTTASSPTVTTAQPPSGRIQLHHVRTFLKETHLDIIGLNQLQAPLVSSIAT